MLQLTTVAIKGMEAVGVTLQEVFQPKIQHLPPFMGDKRKVAALGWGVHTRVILGAQQI